MEYKPMTLKEKLAIIVQCDELDKAGKKAEATALHRTMPVPPFLAKIMKEKVGVDFIINGGWNMSEAEAEFGQNWLIQ
jgi:hypothetical protein